MEQPENFSENIWKTEEQILTAKELIEQIEIYCLSRLED